MSPNQGSKRRRRDAQLAPEMLETRSLLTGGAGNTIAIIPGEITTPGGTAEVKFTLAPTHFTLPKGKLALGVDVVANNSQIKPLISKVKNPDGTIVPQTFHSVYAPHLPQASVAAGAATSAVLTPVRFKHSDPNVPQTYTVEVTAKQKSSGKFLLGFYLPGDANGDGKVDATDVAAIKASLGARAGDPRYSFDADANRDGRIGKIDLAYAIQNLGVSTTVSPVASANLDPASDTGLADRVTTLKDVKFTGKASAGASVKFEEVQNKTQPVTTTVGPTGDYSVMVPLAPGSNTFRVTTNDPFGQSISGTIDPVTYNTSAPVTNSATFVAAKQQQSTTITKV